ncbi:OmpA family protein [uncultured Shimia sp.]|uniref:OmpA family protein n=1 Tax=uncultured Shimia sp. TaxID=573152 RepID=UPI002616EBAB|nr:OmpA family protein [uncultured Shimia sp.]
MKLFAALLLLVIPQMGLAFEPDLPKGARQLTDEERTRSFYELPLGPYRKGDMPTERVGGLLRLQSWRIEGQFAAVTEIGAALAAQLESQGYELVFRCETDDCGGFDFRFETMVLPPPDMFVDLSNFRFVSARKETQNGPEVAGVLISHTSTAAMLQLVSVTPMHPVQLSLVDSQDRESAEQAELTAAELPEDTPEDGGAMRQSPGDMDQLIVTLLDRGHVVLGDLSFETGSSILANGTFSSLETLAAWLQQDSARRVALVGHTDSKGGLDGNVKLSQARAASVQAFLTTDLNVPNTQVESHGIGYLAPIASNLEEGGRDANRRVEAVLLSAP